MEELSGLNKYGILLPKVLNNSISNGHIFYLVCNNLKQRNNFIDYMKNAGIMCVFHYLSLHNSEYFKNKYKGSKLINSDKYSDCLIRLPLYCDLTYAEQGYIIDKTKEFFRI